MAFTTSPITSSFGLSGSPSAATPALSGVSNTPTAPVGDGSALSPESTQSQQGGQEGIQQLLMMLMMLVEELEQSQQQQSNGGGGGTPAVSPASSGGGGGMPSGGGGGVSDSGGSGDGTGDGSCASSSCSASSGGASPNNTPITAPSGSGEKAVQLAQSQMGVQCQNINLPNYNVDGRHTDGCANFVTAVEADAGRYKMTPGDPLVSNFEQDLKNQGWKSVSQQNAQPGDVVIFHNSSGGDQHTEIVGNNGKLIGNNGTSQETVSNDSPNWGDPTFYQPGKGG